MVEFEVLEYEKKTGKLLPMQESYLPSENYKRDLFKEWILFMDASPNTQITYTKAVRYWFDWLKKTGRPQTRESLIKYRNYLEKDKENTTTQTYIAALKVFYQWTSTARLYPDIAAHLKGVSVDHRHHKKDALDEDQAKELLKAVIGDGVKEKRDRAMLALMITTGLRTISMVKADRKDLMTIKGVHYLQYQAKGKTAKVDRVKVPDNVYALLLEYLEARQDKQRPLFGSLDRKNVGSRLNTRSVRGMVKKYMKESGLESARLSAHSLRHTAATLARRNGASLEEVKELLGHSNINTTMIYDHAVTEENNTAANAVAGVLFS